MLAVMFVSRIIGDPNPTARNLFLKEVVAPIDAIDQRSFLTIHSYEEDLAIAMLFQHCTPQGI